MSSEVLAKLVELWISGILAALPALLGAVVVGAITFAVARAGILRVANPVALAVWWGVLVFVLVATAGALRPWVTVPLVLALEGLRVMDELEVIELNMLVWFIAWMAAAYIFLSFAFIAPLPSSVVQIYMGIITLGAIAYFSADRQRLQELWVPFQRFVAERKYTPYMVAVLVLIPAGLAANVYMDMTAPVQAPRFGRTVHPAPPEELEAFGKTFDLRTQDNPLRELENTNPEAFQEHLTNGRRVYYENCFYCHGDDMTGNGIFAEGLNPIPTDFTDPATIVGLQESFLFWRIVKGGRGMPTEGGPWASAMPAWEEFLTEEEIWEVILFLYDFTDQRPRARHEVAH